LSICSLKMLDCSISYRRIIIPPNIKVREKKVDLFELFYDLVFVYAISRVTLILEEPVDGSAAEE